MSTRRWSNTASAAPTPPSPGAATARWSPPRSTDVLADGLSMVYSFFDPDYADRGLGTFMILDHIQRARKMGLPYVYLGYWVEGSRKMDYKRRFRPQEHLMARGWVRVD